MAEWLGGGLQNLSQRFESARDLYKKGDDVKYFIPFFRGYVQGKQQLSNFASKYHLFLRNP